MSHFKDKTVLITGGASGIGLAFATYFAQEGAQVVIADISEANGRAAAAKLNKSGAAVALALQCDVVDYSSVLAAFKAARDFSKSKRIDIVLSNAGTLDCSQPQFSAAEVPSDLDAFYSSAKSPDLRCVDISLLGGLYVCYTALAQFRGQGEDKDGFKGKIILAGSEAGLIHMPGDVLYGVAKAGVNSLARSLGVRVASEGITVNAFAPNLIETNIGPPELFAGAKARGQLTEIKDLLEAVIKYFLLPSSKLSGHLLGGNGADLELRAIPAFFSEHAEKNAEVFFPPDLVRQALQVPEGTKMRKL